jgi:hypothetical protein
MSRESRVSALAEVWWAQVIESGLSPSTERVYLVRLDIPEGTGLVKGHGCCCLVASP